MPDRTLATTHLPHKATEAMWRGARGRCPRCEGAPLFRKFLKPVDRCRACGQDWTRHTADDFPPYVAIIVTGHLMAPVIIEIGKTSLSVYTMVAIVAALAVTMMLSLLQPAKGAIIAVQWWMGLSGYAGAAGRDEAAGSASPAEATSADSRS
ncbi:MAG: DUF983 domain-containing protein [Sphingomonadales bacterium]|nr:DUF983 domain-containing protein [Sphingomonadales bacterium]MDE2570598.1 DUF983 domain-containing protein [Sphingomonadales bacterium]